MTGLRGACGLALVVVVMYQGCLGVPFAHDDHKVVVDSPLVTTSMPWTTLVRPDYFLVSGDSVRYRPVATLSHMIVGRAFGPGPVTHHLVNLSIHVTACLLVSWLLGRLLGPGWPAWLAALWFGLHPAIAEAVLCVTFRRDALVLAFGLASLRVLVETRWRTPTRLALAAVLHLLAVGSKEPAAAWAVLWPGLILGLGDRFDIGPGERTSLARQALVTLVATTLAFAVVAVALGAHNPVVVERPGAAEPVGATAAVARAVSGLGTYVTLMVRPWPLAVERPWAGAPATFDPMFGAGLGFITAVLVLARARPIGAPIVLAALLGFVTPLVPALVFAGDRTAERYLYAPAASAALLVGWALGAGPRSWRWTAHAVLAVGLVVNSLVLLDQIDAWRHPVRLWTRTVEAFPENPAARVALAGALEREGRLPEAKAQLRLALEAPRPLDTALHGLALVLRRERLFRESDDLYRRFLARRPVRSELVVAEYGAFLFNDLGLVKEAVTLLEESVRSAGMPAPWVALAQAYDRCGLRWRAWQTVRQGLAAFPGEPRLIALSGRIGAVPSDTPLEREQYARLMRGEELGPQTPFRRGGGLQVLGRLDEAMAQYRLELSVRPDNAFARANLGTILRQRGRLPEASRELEAAVAARPDLVPALFNLVLVHRDLGDRDRARALIARCLALEPTNPELLREARRLARSP